MARAGRLAAAFAAVVAAALVPCVPAVHVAFLLPPASPMGAMMPVVMGCLDAGHNVTLLVHNEYEARLLGMVPRAHVVPVGPMSRQDVDANKMRFIMGMPYTLYPVVVALIFRIVLEDLMIFPLVKASVPALRELRPDVIAVAPFPSGLALGELLGVPAVVLTFGPPTFLTMLDAPWSTEPAFGSWYSREDIAADPGLLVLNTAVRLFGVYSGIVGNLLHNWRRWRLGLTRLEDSQFALFSTSPMVVPALPEHTAGYPAFTTPYTVMAGIYDHPALGGASLALSDQHDEIVSWLDAHHAEGTDVLYTAFGSEVVLSRERMEQMVVAFGNLTVLWSLKKAPADLRVPDRVKVTKWAPQKAVLAHPVVKAFFSSGGANSVRESLAAGKPMLIMPIIFDTPYVGMIHERLGVVLRVGKQELTQETVTAQFRRLCSPEFQDRASYYRQLNDKHVSLDRAVEVIEEAAAHKFPAPPQATSVATAIALVFQVLFLLASCRCCCRCCGAVCCGRHRGRHADGKPKHE